MGAASLEALEISPGDSHRVIGSSGWLVVFSPRFQRLVCYMLMVMAHMVGLAPTGSWKVSVVANPSRW